MAKLAIFERTDAFRHELAARGHHVVYRASETNRCPGCGRAQWYVGRVTAECVFCGTAIVLAEAEHTATGKSQDNRRHKRVSAKGRTLQLLVDGSPHSFALENISFGGAMGHDSAGLAPNTSLQVRLEDGATVAAVVKWVDGDLVGLAFEGPGH